MSQLVHDAQELLNWFPKARLTKWHGGNKDPWAVEIEGREKNLIIPMVYQPNHANEIWFAVTDKARALKLPVIIREKGVYYQYKDVHRYLARSMGRRLNQLDSERDNPAVNELMKNLERLFGAVRI